MLVCPGKSDPLNILFQIDHTKTLSNVWCGGQVFYPVDSLVSQAKEPAFLIIISSFSVDDLY